MTAATAPIQVAFRKVFYPCNVPFLLLLAMHVSFCIDCSVSKNIHGDDSPMTRNIKFILTVYLAGLFAWNVSKYKVRHLVYLGLLAVVFAWNVALNSYNLTASLAACGRYLLPLLFLFYGYSYRNQFDRLVSAVFFITIVNDVVQCVIYAYHFAGLTLVPMEILYGILPRASGLAGMIAFALMNLVSAVLAYYCLEEKKRLRYCYTFLAFAIASFSFKVAPAIVLFVAATVRLRKRAMLTRLAATTACLIAVFVVERQTGVLSEAAIRRYDDYAVRTDSARRDSYRVMLESLSHGNLLGEGLGYFGGPVSVTFNSPAYAEYDFSWAYGTDMMTTDTYYPHVFVELGLLGGLLYLGMFILPVVSQRGVRNYNAPYFLLLFALFVDSLTSFSIQSFDSILITSLLFGLCSQHVTAPSISVEELNRRAFGSMRTRNRASPHFVGRPSSVRKHPQAASASRTSRSEDLS